MYFKTFLLAFFEEDTAINSSSDASIDFGRKLFKKIHIFSLVLLSNSLNSTSMSHFSRLRRSSIVKRASVETMFYAVGWFISNEVVATPKRF